ncbi:MAG TPA: phospholipase D-like domain-containing protein, partial [Pirellula sp.]|nr:phospholipase D-like domain-containing protein [Pirellula sp.]
MTGSGFCRNTFLVFTTFFLSIGSVVKASTVRLLHSEVEAFAIRLELIEAAQSTIDLSSYEISDDNTSGRFLVAMLNAVERGVVVRVLVDGHIGDNLMPKPLMHYLIEHGVAIRERPLNVRYQFELGRSRLHDKLLIVDRTHLITGGRNVGQQHFGIGDRKCIDRDVYVNGQSACHAADYFAQRWNESKSGQPDLNRAEARKNLALQVHPEWNTMPREQALEFVAKWLGKLSTGPMPAQDLCNSAIHFDALEIDESNIRFLHDIVGESKQANGAIAPEILRLLQQAC